MKRASSSKTLGANAFAMITAVEGLRLNAASKKRIASQKKQGLNNDQRRQEILSAYRSGN